MADTNTNLFRGFAEISLTLREGLIGKLYAKQLTRPDSQTQAIGDLIGSFSRFAGNHQTAFDTGTSRTSSTSTMNVLERQVERAMNQVLGRAPGRGYNSFVSALNGAFPTSPDGQSVVFTPSRSVVSVYNTSNSTTLVNGQSLANQLPARQAALYRQGRIVVDDALKVLAGLMAFVPEAIPEQVEALRNQLASEFSIIADEFGRVDEPRGERVKAYLDTLTLHLTTFGRRAFLDQPDFVATAEDESMVAGFALLKNYRDILRTIWAGFQKDDQSSISYSLGERVERANTMLPIVTQANFDFEAAMDSVDFTEADRHSLAAKFTTLNAFGPVDQNGETSSLPQANMTVYDLNEWLDRFASIEGPQSLAASGQYGLDFVTDQANRLFWVVAPVVAYLRTPAVRPYQGRIVLEQVLANERVGWSLDNLLIQLHTLAKLAVPAGWPGKNPINNAGLRRLPGFQDRLFGQANNQNR